MIVVRYRDYSQIADLAGKSAAEVREQYRNQFDIPDKAHAKLNGRKINRGQETQTLLKDSDELIFAGKSRKGLVMVAACLLALAVSGGVFAFTWTTASATIGATADSDYAAVAPADSLPSFSTNVFGKHRGDVPTGDLFTITPEADYTGDLVVKVYLTNADELSPAYQHLNLKLELWDSNVTTPVNIFASETGHTFQLLTLDNGVVTFDLEYGAGTSPYKVKLAGGGYTTNARSPLDWESGYAVAPLLYCEVTQR